MSEPILRIHTKKYQADTTVVSMRLPKDMLRDIDSVASMTGRTRNEILTTSVEFALKHMEIVLREEEK